MIVDRYEPVNLFALVPQLGSGFDASLRALDALLDDDLIFQRIKADLTKAHPRSCRKGRHSTPVEVILRMLLVRRLYHWSYEDTEHVVADSLVLRQFCRVYLEAVPDDTTLIRWAHLVCPETLDQLNERVVQLAQQHQVTRGRKLRVDSTVVETTIHHPTDSGLLADSVRVMSRLLRRAKRVIGEGATVSREVFRTRTRSVRRLTQQLHRVARRKGEAAAEELTDTHQSLIRVAEQSQRQAATVVAALADRTEREGQRLREQFAQVLPRVDQVIDQTRRRVIQGETVPATEKLPSLFEPHTQIIKRQKPGKPVEFRRKLWLEAVEGGIVSSYRVLEEPGRDAPALPQLLVDHHHRFGKPPRLVAGDRGVFSPGHQVRCHPCGDPLCREGISHAETAGEDTLVPSGVPLPSGDRRADQCLGPLLWGGPMPRARGGGDGTASRVGDRHGQPGQDRRDGGGASGQDDMILGGEDTKRGNAGHENHGTKWPE